MAVVLAVFLDLVGFGIVVPQLPLAAARFTSSGLVIGLVVATDSLLSFLLAPRWGRLSDRIGRRPVILLGLAGSAIAYTVFGLASSLAVLFVARILSGSLGATVNVAQAALADTTPPEQRSKAMGLIGAAFGLAFTIGPALGGIASRRGEGAPGLLAGGICLVNFLIAVGVPSREPDAPGAGLGCHGAACPGPRCWSPSRRPSRSRRCTWYSSSSAPEKLGLTRAGISYAFTLVGLVSVLVQGRLVRRLAPKLGELRLVMWGGGLMAWGWHCCRCWSPCRRMAQRRSRALASRWRCSAPGSASSGPALRDSCRAPRRPMTRVGYWAPCRASGQARGSWGHRYLVSWRTRAGSRRRSGCRRWRVRYRRRSPRGGSAAVAERRLPGDGYFGTVKNLPQRMSEKNGSGRQLLPLKL